jgi:hypothetical protein
MKKERPILFRGPMVRALLDGSKTQTRRICKNQPYPNGFKWDGNDFLCHNDYLPPSAMLMDGGSKKFLYTTSDVEGWESECTYGQPGDRLWVRETFNGPMWFGEIEPPDSHTPEYCHYKADGGETPEYMDADDNLVCRWKPSIHMPRWASRITLEIVSVRVERLQDISEADALAEGIDCRHLIVDTRYEGGSHVEEWAGRYFYDGLEKDEGLESAEDDYAALWERINGAGSWAANPWVWVIEFRGVDSNG